MLEIASNQDDQGLDNLVVADWVFAYGSLIWNPEINYERAVLGRVYGRHRNFCVRSTKYRGTPDSPGVVLGLDQGGSCLGVAYKFCANEKLTSIEQLYKREMLNQVYHPILIDVHLAGSQVSDHQSNVQTKVQTNVQTKVRALTFVANRLSDSYLHLTEEQLVTRLRGCSGERGPNRDYAINTWTALKEYGVNDQRLGRLAQQLLG
jgi:glutathione-specific gamma-glutamylcyclotransferase